MTCPGGGWDQSQGGRGVRAVRDNGGFALVAKVVWSVEDDPVPKEEMIWYKRERRPSTYLFLFFYRYSHQ